MTQNAGIETEHMDQDTRPQDDLFQHVNGTWLRTAQIPEDRGRYGAFDRLRENAEQNVRELIEESAAASDDAEPGSAERKVGDLYGSFMDIDQIAELGLSPLAKDLAAIEAITDTTSLVRTIGALQRSGVDGLIHPWVTADAGSPGEYILYLHQGGLGMPDEAYYRDDQHAGVRDAYRTYLATLLDLAAPAIEQAGLDVHADSSNTAGGEDTVSRVVAVETAIAAEHWDRIAARDAVKSYTKWSAEEFAERTPGLDWDAYRDGLGLSADQVSSVIARQPDMLTGLGGLLRQRDLADWKAWLTIRVLDWAAPYLTDDFVAAHFAFHGAALSGTPANRPRWKRGVSLVEELLGEAAGELYVARHYPPEAAQRMQHLVEHVIEAFRRRIAELDWMGEQTRARALEKLEQFRPKIGHPPTWKDYSAFRVDARDLLGNVRRGNAVEADREFAKIGGPIDRDEWLMTPQTVNAYYHPMLNEIVFPAAILQPPFFSVDAEDAVNFGGIGAVIAHEIGHGFDDQGSRYAGDGSLQDWWTEDDRAAFDARAGRLIEQFDQVEPRDAPGSKVSGGLTVGENIGDLCGLELALRAYRIAGGGPEMNGWTDEQRFFLGWAQVWRGKARAEEARRLVAIDPHSPVDARGNVVRNVDAFHEAFATSEGDGMWLAPQDRVRIF